jgi:hypothetical protein
VIFVHEKFCSKVLSLFSHNFSLCSYSSTILHNSLFVCFDFVSLNIKLSHVGNKLFKKLLSNKAAKQGKSRKDFLLCLKLCNKGVGGVEARLYSFLISRTHCHLCLLWEKPTSELAKHPQNPRQESNSDHPPQSVILKVKSQSLQTYTNCGLIRITLYDVLPLQLML